MASLRGSRAIVRSLERLPSQISPQAVAPSFRLTQQIPSRHSVPIATRLSASQQRSFAVLRQLRKEDPPSPSGLPPPRSYKYQEIHDIVTDPSPNRILIDVREPAELLQTGRIPTAKAVPISSAPDAFFMTEEDFQTRFGFPRPSEKDEVIFYCKAGVRSRQAALLASQATPPFGGKVANYNGSWLDWEKNGGKVEQEGEQGEQSSLSGVTGAGQGAPRP